MLEDLQLMQIIEAFLRENISSDYVDNIYRHSPPADSDDPYIIVGIAGSDEDRVEITGGNSYTVQAQITILTTNYDFSTPQLRDSIERLYTTTHHVRVALESSNYLEYVRNTVRIIGSTVRLDDISRAYGITNIGQSKHLSATITTPFIVFQEKVPL